MLRKYFQCKRPFPIQLERKIVRVQWLRKRRANKGYRRFEKTYNILQVYSKKLTRKVSDYSRCCFFFSLPKRQHQFTIWNFKPYKHENFSTGKFLNTLKKHVKFYKRDSRNTATVMLQLKKIYGLTLKYVYYMRISNYNYRQFNFFSKYMELFNPYIYFLQHRQSFIPRWTNKRRIKRRILRLISSM